MFVRDYEAEACWTCCCCRSWRHHSSGSRGKISVHGTPADLDRRTFRCPDSVTGHEPWLGTFSGFCLADERFGSCQCSSAPIRGLYPPRCQQGQEVRLGCACSVLSDPCLLGLRAGGRCKRHSSSSQPDTVPQSTCSPQIWQNRDSAWICKKINITLKKQSVIKLNATHTLLKILKHVCETPK